MAVYSAWRTGRFEGYGMCLLPYGMFLLEKCTFQLALNVACKAC